MLSVMLNIVGLLLIIYSIYIISKENIGRKDHELGLIDLQQINKQYDEVDDEEIFQAIMKSKVETSESIGSQSTENLEKDIIYEKPKTIIKEKNMILDNNNINPLYQNIFELKLIGLTNEEIARKFGRGIREIDIILKMYRK